jgi:hypothetical protein
VRHDAHQGDPAPTDGGRAGALIAAVTMPRNTILINEDALIDSIASRAQRHRLG